MSYPAAVRLPRSPIRRTALLFAAAAWAVVGCGGDSGRSGTADGGSQDVVAADGFQPGGGVPTFDSSAADAADSTDVTADLPIWPDVGDSGTGPDVPLACGVLGGACDDSDVCTFNDTCRADGTCSGTPLDCDDGAPCTIDKCVGGTCTSGVAAGFCFIDGACWSDNQPNPTSPACQFCDADKNVGAWSGTIGFSCNDSNACTQQDVCTADGCVGTATNCDDSNPCTTDACNPGTGCTHAPIAGSCTVAGQSACLAGVCQNGQCVAQPAKDGDPCDNGDPCTVPDGCLQGACVAGPPLDADNDGFSPIECGGTDCNDGVQAINPDAVEDCTDGIDNDCNGATDGADEACCGGEACAYHTDCYPEKFCAEWPGCGKRCSTPCAGPLDCPAGEICTHMPGSAGYGYCRASKYPEGKDSGAVCGSSKECKSEICVGICGDYCARESACPNATCSPAGSLQGTFFGVCAPGIGIGTIGLGQRCNNSNNCVSGHCDLLSTFMTCSPLCKSDSDCLLSQECNIALPAGGSPPGTVGGKPPADSVPFDPAYTNKTFDVALACFTRQYPQATGAVGSLCTHPNQCRSNKCFYLDPAQPNQQWCTTYCTSNADCPANMACKQDIVTLVSYWLTAKGGGNPNVGTFVRICKWQ